MPDISFVEHAVAWLNGISGMAWSIHGWLAFALLIMGVAAMNIGLMRLSIHSNRSGHDRKVGHPRPGPQRKGRD